MNKKETVIFGKEMKATDPEQLRKKLYDSHTPKTELEHFAIREIDALLAQIYGLQSEVSDLNSKIDMYKDDFKSKQKEISELEQELVKTKDAFNIEDKSTSEELAKEMIKQAKYLSNEILRHSAEQAISMNNYSKFLGEMMLSDSMQRVSESETIVLKEELSDWIIANKDKILECYQNDCWNKTEKVNIDDN